MYVFLDKITHRYAGVKSPALAGVSLFVRSGEIASVVGLPGAGKSTLLRIVAAHGDKVLIGSADHREPGDVRPGLVRGWRFCDLYDRFAPEWRPEEWRGVPLLRYAFPNMALDGSAPGSRPVVMAPRMSTAMASCTGLLHGRGRLPTTKVYGTCCLLTT